jgi:peptide/nickel transport system ATP-binding protein
MHKGEIIEQGLKSEILSPPHPEYTELLLSSVPEMDINWLNRKISKKNLGAKRPQIK